MLKVDYWCSCQRQDFGFGIYADMDPTYEKLIEAVKAATDTGVRVMLRALSQSFFLPHSGFRKPGSMYDWGSWGAAIQETMESYEVEVNGKVLPGELLCFGHTIVLLVTIPLSESIENLSGHTIGKYQVHGGGNRLPLVRTENQTKMEEGEYFAIETFGSTGRGPGCRECE